MPETLSKPIVKGPIDGNIFVIVAACSSALKRAGQKDNVETLQKRVHESESYSKALSICMEYVTFDL